MMQASKIMLPDLSVLDFMCKRLYAARLEWVYSKGMRKIRALTILMVSLPLLFSSVPTAQAACNTYDNGFGGQSGTCNGARTFDRCL